MMPSRLAQDFLPWVFGTPAKKMGGKKTAIARLLRLRRL